MASLKANHRDDVDDRGRVNRVIAGKALSNAAFEESRKQLGLIDISDRIAEKRRTEEAEEELENESLERLLNLDLEI